MKYSKRLQFCAFIVIAGFSLFTACDTTDSSDGTGTLAVKLTDAPADYDAVYIDIQAIRVKAVEDDNPAIDENDETGWLTISDESQRINLLEWQNGEAILIGEEEVAAGFYHQIRLILGPDNAIVIGDVTYPLKTPSAQQSGLKLNIDAEVVTNEVYVLLLDFNAAKSIVEKGNGTYGLKPVIRTVELEETGSIEGVVQPDNFQTEVMAIANGDTLTTFTGDEGEFMFIGVLSGSYDILFNVPDTVAYADTLLTGIEVAIDEDVDLGTISLSQK